MNILILYFSGTGNTHFIAELIKKQFSKQGNFAESLPVEIADLDEIKKFDILAFGFPIYACKMPDFLKKYTDKFTLPKTKKIILFSTFGFTACNGMRETAHYFALKGFKPVYAKGIKIAGSDELLLIKKTSRKAKILKKTNFANKPEVKKFIKEAVKSINANEPIISGNMFWTPVIDLLLSVNEEDSR